MAFAGLRKKFVGSNNSKVQTRISIVITLFGSRTSPGLFEVFFMLVGVIHATNNPYLIEVG